MEVDKGALLNLFTLRRKSRGPVTPKSIFEIFTECLDLKGKRQTQLSIPGLGVSYPSVTHHCVRSGPSLTRRCLGFTVSGTMGLTSCRNCVESLSRRQGPSLTDTGLQPFPSPRMRLLEEF